MIHSDIASSTRYLHTPNILCLLNQNNQFQALHRQSVSNLQNPSKHKWKSNRASRSLSKKKKKMKKEQTNKKIKLENQTSGENNELQKTRKKKHKIEMINNQSQCHFPKNCSRHAIANLANMISFYEYAITLFHTKIACKVENEMEKKK